MCGSHNLYFSFLLGKGCYWALHNKCSTMFENGSFLRRRKRFKAEKVASDDAQSFTAPSPMQDEPRISSLPQPPEVSPMARVPDTLRSMTHPLSSVRLSGYSDGLNTNNLLMNSSLLSNPNSLAAYSQLMQMQMSSYPWPYSTLFSMPNLFSSTLTDPVALRQAYANLLHAQSLRVKPEPSSDCESYGDRSSPRSVAASSPASTHSIDIVPQQEALDLTKCN